MRPFVCFYLMLHEQAHHWPEVDPDPPPAPEPPGDDTPHRRAIACGEVAAECETFYSLWIYYLEGPTPPSQATCALIQTRMARWRDLWERCNNNFFIGNYCPEALLLLSLCP